MIIKGIYINNHNINRINRKNIRRFIELLDGESFLFSGEILENIKLKNNYDENKFNKLMNECELVEEINKFEEKEKTIIGENGIKLSGGQRQRIALARTLYQDKRIILIDEGLNKLDNTTKLKVLKNLYLNNKEKTILFATHDMEILKLADKIIFTNNNTTYVGTHNELYKKNKEYKKFIKYSMSG